MSLSLFLFKTKLQHKISITLEKTTFLPFSIKEMRSKTRATLKGLCLYIKEPYKPYIRLGRLLQILNLMRGANFKRGTYLKLGANSSIYGKL